MSDRDLPTGRGRLASTLALFVLAPASAEYLSGYDSSTGDPVELLAGLWILGPLYGGPAVLIREAVRRTGRGWPSILLLGLAFGVVQAGLIDHSLFNTSYRDIEYWKDMLEPTFLPALGIGAFPAVAFILAHAVWSIGAPIALVELLAPGRAASPWLGRAGLAAVAGLYVAASALILIDHVQGEEFVPSPPQLLGAAATAAALIAAAFLIGRGPETPVDGRVPGPWPVGLASAAAFGLPVFLGEGWWAVAAMVGLAAGLAVAAISWSRREGWGPLHHLALAAGPLAVRAGEAFLVTPIGDVPTAAKLAHNVAFALGVVLLVAAAARAAATSPERTP